MAGASASIPDVDPETSPASRSERSSAFDPRLGCQELSTGVLGAFFMFSLVLSYGVYKLTVPLGGPALVNPFPWFPPRLRFAHVNREFVDLVAILGLGVFLMASWELLRTRVERASLFVVAVTMAAVAWPVAFASPWFLPAPVAEWHGWRVTRMEIVLLLCALGLLLVSTTAGAYRLQALRPDLSRWRHALRTSFFRWLAGLLAFTTILVVAFSHPFYLSGYYENWRIMCAFLYSLYVLLGLPYTFVTNLKGSRFSHDVKDPGFVLLLLGRSLLRRPRVGTRISSFCLVLLNRRTLVALRDLMVKIFFVPIMTSFFFGNCGDLSRSVPFTAYSTPNVPNAWQFSFRTDTWYGVLFHGMMVMDVALGLIGYLCSSRWLGNKSVSVEPTLLGWMVALACYPPFNQVSGTILPYHDAMGGMPLLDVRRLGLDPATTAFLDRGLDGAFRAVALTGYVVYVYATMAFGLRFSNLTHRGIITRGPYAYVRHPAYIGKNIAWWAESLRNFASPWQFVFLAAWNVIYLMRAITEERHLSKDPDYVAYCRQVPCRFLPGVI